MMVVGRLLSFVGVVGRQKSEVRRPETPAPCPLQAGTKAGETGKRFQVSGFRFQVSGSRFQVPGSRCRNENRAASYGRPGKRFQV